MKKYNEKTVYIYNVPLKQTGIFANIEICANSKAEAYQIACGWAAQKKQYRICRARFWDESEEGYILDDLTPNPADANGRPTFDYSENYY